MKKELKALIVTAIVGLMLFMFITTFTSCSRNGYGCRGNSRTMTGEGMFKRGSRLN